MNAGATSCRCSPVIFKVFMFLCLAFSRPSTHDESATVDSHHGTSLNAICFIGLVFVNVRFSVPGIPGYCYRCSDQQPVDHDVDLQPCCELCALVDCPVPSNKPSVNLDSVHECGAPPTAVSLPPCSPISTVPLPLHRSPEIHPPRSRTEL